MSDSSFNSDDFEIPEGKDLILKAVAESPSNPNILATAESLNNFKPSVKPSEVKASKTTKKDTSNTFDFR
jgi:hypothetical protein